MEYEDEKKIPPGTVIDDKYRVETMIGKGGMGGVYEATQLALGRKVALKHLYPRYAGNEKAFIRFRQEAMSAASIGHDNICEVTDLGIGLDRAPYLVMPLLRGYTVHEMIRSHGTLSTERVVDVGAQILSGLQAAHRAGIIHRDLKPANVFVTRLGDRGDFVKLLDFGVSKVMSDSRVNDLTRTGEVVGTPHYMAPEQAKGDRNLDQRVDLYAAGVIIYEMLTRRRPFDGDSYNEVMYKILTEPFRYPRELNPMVPVEIEAVVIKAMSRESRDRYENASVMGDALLAAGRGQVSSVAQPAPTAVLPSVSEDKISWRGGADTSGPSSSISQDRLDDLHDLRHRTRTPISTGSVSASLTPSRQSKYLNESWVHYRGKEILLRDFSNLGQDRSARVIESSLLSTHEIVLEGKKGLHIVVDMTGWFADKHVSEKMKKMAALLKPYTSKFAVVGVTGLQTVLIGAMKRKSGLDIKIFDTKDEAMEWMAE